MKSSKNHNASKVTLTLFVEGAPAKVQDAVKQITHYASSLPGVQVDK